MSSLALRQARHLATASAAAASTSAATISISKAKSVLRSEHDPDKALEIYSSVSGHYSSPLSSRYAQEYTVKRLAKSHRFSDIEAFLESHKKDPKVSQEPFLATIIRSYGIVGMFDNALSTYEQMTDLGTPRSSVSFNALLSACIHSKLYDRVPQLFDEIPKKYKVSPDRVSFGILIRSYCEVGTPKLAMEKLKEMEGKGMQITAIPYTTIMNSLYKKGMSDEAEKVWDEMVKSGCELDVGAYNVRIMNIQGGNPDGVKGLIDEMSNLGLKPDIISYNYLMTCYCRNGMMDEAEQVYNNLEDNFCKPNATTFRTLIYYACQQGQFDTGYKVFNKSVTMNKIPDFNTLKHLVRGLVTQSKTIEAKSVISIVKSKFPPNVLKAWTKLEEELGLTNDETPRV
nr:pentatricopeptide repeat-containing protein At4g36680, mitochondrial-like [Ipomoea batatas]